MAVAHTSRIRIEKHAGPYRTAHIENFEKPLDFGIHGGIKDFYDGLTKTGASAALAASIFHYGEATVGDVKRYLRRRGVPVRV